jgi:hypothetical protein
LTNWLRSSRASSPDVLCSNLPRQLAGVSNSRPLQIKSYSLRPLAYSLLLSSPYIAWSYSLHTKRLLHTIWIQRPASAVYNFRLDSALNLHNTTYDTLHVHDYNRTSARLCTGDRSVELQGNHYRLERPSKLTTQLSEPREPTRIYTCHNHTKTSLRCRPQYRFCGHQCPALAVKVVAAHLDSH